MDLSERQLIARFRRGDRDAFEEVVGRWSRDITNLAFRMTGHHEDARDVAQQCFLRAYQSRQRFEGNASLGTWLYRIAVNICRDRLRAERSRRRVVHAISNPRNRPRPGHRPVRSSATETDETQARIAEAMASLPAAEREVAVLRHYHGLSCREIAELLDAPYTTIKSRLVQGLDRLRIRLRDLDPCASG